MILGEPDLRTRLSPALGRSDAVDEIAALPAAQQPVWPDSDAVRRAIDAVATDDLVAPHESRRLEHDLEQVDAAGGLVLQLGDCVEDIGADVAADVRAKLAFIEAMGDHLEDLTSRPVLTVGRVAGQYAKPRSNDVEHVGGTTLPAYRGPVVNHPEPTAEARRPDPANIVRAHEAARIGQRVVGRWNAARRTTRTIWTSHEMLLLAYELRCARASAGGRLHLSTTHWPWIGARTRQPDGAHVALAAMLDNPVSVKIGPTTTAQEAVDLSRRLGVDGRPAHVTYIARMGRDREDQLRSLAEHVRRHGAPVRWICDPMHGNTFATPAGLKTRRIDHVVSELRTFQRALLAARVRPAGIHLEATPQDVYECCDQRREPELGGRYRSLLDPRLNTDQTRHVLDAWFV